VIYELREYTAVPGKLPALVKRFNDHTLGLFRKHGMRLVFISHTQVGDNSLNEVVYMMQFDSYEQLEQQWRQFMADPEWQRVKADSETDGPLNVRVRRRILDSSPFPS
jgi:hypothetical protein